MIKLDVIRQLQGPLGPFDLNVNETIEKGEVVAVFGDSGVGKTTLLRMIAGLTHPDRGTIEVEGRDWSGLPIQKRKVGFVFQDYALFPNMTVKENLSFAIKENGNGKQVDDILDLIEMKELRNAYPDKLSGGQKQRVALARALLSDCEILLLDEPFSSLDKNIKRKLSVHLREHCERTGIVAILVSHDIEEIFHLADKVWVLEKGEVIKTGTPDKVISRPENKFNN
jgi:molybdate transport system ATP-binding protein